MRAKFVFESQHILNKIDVIREILQQFDEEIRDELKKDLMAMSKDEFDEWVEYAGYNKMGKYWTAANVY